MFHKATLKLTAIYLSIMMVISLAFSFGLYQISIKELDRGLRRQSDTLLGGPRLRQFITDLSQINISHQQELEQSKSSLKWQLLFINIGILVGGGILSYGLARRSLKPIEKAHQAQSRFTADASHELRTPLAVMQTEIEVALMDPKLTLKDAKQQLISNLEELAKLTGLTQGLLQLAKLDNNSLAKANINLNEVIKSVIKQAKPRADKKAISITTKLSVNLKVAADKIAIEEALLTILDNAIKYSPEKSVISVDSTKHGDHALINVKDSGIGIGEEDLKHIFERFYRADTARSNQGNHGYGLGLAIAKNIIDLHSGEITATSQLNAGSTFTIKLPLA